MCWVTLLYSTRDTVSSVNCLTKEKSRGMQRMEKLRLPDLMSSLLILEWALLCILNLSHPDNFKSTNIWEKKYSKYIALKGFQSSESEIQLSCLFIEASFPWASEVWAVGLSEGVLGKVLSHFTWQVWHWKHTTFHGHGLEGVHIQLHIQCLVNN